MNDLKESTHRKQTGIDMLLADAIVQTVREPLLVLTGDMRVKSANDAFYRTFRTSAEDTLGRPFLELGHGPWDVPALRELLEDILPNNQEVTDYEVRDVFPRIGARMMHLNARRLQESDGDGELILLAIEDVTERVKAKERIDHLNTELARSNGDLEKFAYIASHDLQEPLRDITNSISFVLKNAPDALDERIHRFLGYAQEGAQRMQSLIDDLLTWSRVQTKAKPFTTFPLVRAVDRALVNLHAAIESTGAEIEIGELPEVDGDEWQITLLVQNLIHNAVKYTADRAPKIHVTAERVEEKWVVSVTDNGIGIDSVYLDRLFTMFQRLHTQQEYPGSGLGLSICKRIVERHGGRIWVESESGQGSTFRFTMPLVKEAAA